MAMRPSLPVPTLSRRAKIIIGVVVLLVLVLSVLGSLVRLYVDWLWFGEVDYRQVFTTGLRTRILLFVVFGLLMAAVIAANLWSRTGSARRSGRCRWSSRTSTATGSAIEPRRS